MKKLIKKLKNDFIFLTFATVLGSFIKLFYSVFSKKMVEPADYGIFSAICIISTYLNYLQLGTMNAYNRDYPQLRGAKRVNEAKEIKDATLTYLLIVYGSVMIAALFVIPYLSSKNDYSSFQTVGYVFAFVGALFTVVNAFATFSAKMEGKFNYAASVYIIQISVGVGLGLWLIHKFGCFGLFAEGIISSVIGCVMLYKYWMKDFRINLNCKLIWGLLISGIPLLVNNLIWTVVGSIDKFVILGFMDTTTLGYYSIATMGFSTMVLIPQTMSNVFYIKVNEEYGKTGNKVHLISSSQKYTFISALCTGFICLVAFYALPIFVDLVMPNYKNGVEAAQIIIIGVAIYASTLLYGNIFTILKEHKALLINSVCLCIFNAVLSVSLVAFGGRNIENVARGTSISYALYSVLLVIRLIKISKLSFWSFFYYSWLPVLSAVVPCTIFQELHLSEYVKMVFSMIIFLGICGMFYANEIKGFLKLE